MRLLERYILWELVRVFSVLVTIFTVLLVFVGVVAQARQHGLGMAEIIQILPYVPPSLLPYTIPATMLLTVCVVYGRMSADREIIAAKSAGVHVISLIWPSYFLGAVLSVGTLFMTDQIIPWSMGNIGRVVRLAMENIFLDQLRTQSQVNNRKLGIAITVLDVRNRVLIMPTFRYSPGGKETFTAQAEEARLSFDLSRQEVVVQMKKAHINAPGRITGWFENHEDRFPLPIDRAGLQVQTMRILDIKAKLQTADASRERLRDADAMEAAFAMATGEFEKLGGHSFVARSYEHTDTAGQIRRMKTEVSTRFAMATSCFFFVLVGSPFAILMARKQFLTSFLFCFLPILVIYYPVAMLSQNLSKTGMFDPTWAVWSANALLLIAGCVCIRRVLQN
jgi:lipopolysaccharide export system permease protein